MDFQFQISFSVINEVFIYNYLKTYFSISIRDNSIHIYSEFIQSMLLSLKKGIFVEKKSLY